jgi:hypothetical protein
MGLKYFRARFREAELYSALGKRMKLRLLFYGMITNYFLFSSQALAQGGTQKALSGLDSAASTAELSQASVDLPGLIGDILAIVLGFTGTIFFILVVWAGMLWMTAGGSQENIKKAQDILKAAVVGLIIVLSAYAITRFVGSSLQPIQ